MISGASLKEIVDGQLVEEVDEEAAEGHGDGAAVAALTRETRETRRELSAVKKDVSELKAMLKDVMQLIQRGGAADGT